MLNLLRMAVSFTGSSPGKAGLFLFLLETDPVTLLFFSSSGPKTASATFLTNNW